jgi:hypothetical protein
MITGKVPFDRPNSVNILMAHVNEEAPPMRQMNPNISLTPAIEDTVGRCMAKDPDQRFRSMDEVLAALKRVGGAALTATVSGVGTGEYRSLAGSGSGPQVSSQSGSHNGVGSGPNPAFLSPSGSDPGSLPSPLGMPSDSPAVGIGVPLVSQPPGRSGSKGTLVAAVVGALALAGVVGYVALRPGRPLAGLTTPAGANPTDPAATTTATPTDRAPVAPVPPVAAAMVKVRINSDPDGASVKEDGVELCSSTPCDLMYKGPDADPAKDHKLTLTRNGYKVETKVVKVGDSPVNVKLTAAPIVYQRPVPAAKPADTQAPSGYKSDIPY